MNKKIAWGTVIVALLVLAGGVALLVGRHLPGSQMPSPDSPEPPAELMQSLILEDRALGDAAAPNTIIEYASMTCPHCAHFHTEIFPRLKTDYIDKGKVRYIFREFPLDPSAAVAAMLLRCMDEDRFFDSVTALFKAQEAWARAPEQDAGIMLLALLNKQGMSKEEFNQCLGNRDLFERIVQSKRMAHDQFRVESTPTLFVNGRKLGAVSDLAELEPYLKQ